MSSPRASRRSGAFIGAPPIAVIGVGLLFIAVPLGIFAASFAPRIEIGDGLALDTSVAPWVALVSAFVLAAPTVLVWRSRWNIVAVTQLGLFAAGYFVPLVLLNTLGGWPAPTEHTYIGILVLGAIGASSGVFIGNYLTNRTRRVGTFVARVVGGLSDDIALRRIWQVGLATMVLLVACFVAMGFVPLIASDPTAAKYLSGAYNVKRSVAFVYHLAVPAASYTVPLLIGAGIHSKQWRYHGLAAVLFALLIGTNQRGLATFGFFAILLILGAAGRVRWVPVALIVLFLTPLGSASSYLLTNLGFNQFARTNQGQSIVQAIGAGSPDVSDAQTVLGNYLEAPAPTHGKTFYGALAYTGGDYVPSRWSLRIANPSVTDLDKLQSGGIRMPSALWGFFAWGWWGVLGTTLVSGLLVGAVIGAVRDVIGRGTFLQSVVLGVVVIAFGTFAQLFYVQEWIRIAAWLPVAWVLLGGWRAGRAAHRQAG